MRNSKQPHPPWTEFGVARAPNGLRNAPDVRRPSVHDNVGATDFACCHGPQELPLRPGGPRALTRLPLPPPGGLGLAWSILINVCSLSSLNILNVTSVSSIEHDRKKGLCHVGWKHKDKTSGSVFQARLGGSSL